MACEAEQRAYDEAVAGVQAAIAKCIREKEKGERTPGEIRACEIAKRKARVALREAEEALRACLLAAPSRSTQTQGLVTFLLVVEPGIGYGGGDTNWIDVDVIFKLDRRPDKAFGFRLREDDFGLARGGMLSLLEDAFIHGLLVTASYIEAQVPLNQNCFVTRVALTKPKPTQPGDMLEVMG